MAASTISKLLKATRPLGYGTGLIMSIGVTCGDGETWNCQFGLGIRFGRLWEWWRLGMDHAALRPG